MKLLTILFILPVLGVFEFTDDLKKVTDHFEFDPLCTFNHSEITSKTIEFFPRCTTVCGVLIMNENLDLDESQLADAFSSMVVLYGGIRIENNLLRSLNFFNVDNYFEEFSVFCETYGVFIRNNARLQNIDNVLMFYFYGDDGNNECDFIVEYNDQLDTRILTDREKMKGHYDIKANWNEEDTICRQDEIVTVKSLDYKHCSHIFGGLHLQNTKDPVELIAIEEIEQIFGPLIIENTALEDLAFLDRLEYIEADVMRADEPAFINLKNNLEMKELNMKNLKELRGNGIVNLENLHPNFCLTTELMRLFLETGTFFIHLDVAQYCDGPFLSLNGKLCVFSKLEDLSSGCNYIFGDVIVGSGDEQNVNKLKMVTFLFGRLIVNNTELENLNFSSNLQHIAALHESPPIQITGNPNLTNAKFKQLENLITKSPQYVILENNHPDLPTSEDYLDLFPPYLQNRINYTNEKIVPLRMISSEGPRFGMLFGILLVFFLYEITI